MDFHTFTLRVVLCLVGFRFVHSMALTATATVEKVNSNTGCPRHRHAPARWAMLRWVKKNHSFPAGTRRGSCHSLAAEERITNVIGGRRKNRVLQL